MLFDEEEVGGAGAMGSADRGGNPYGAQRGTTGSGAYGSRGGTGYGSGYGTYSAKKNTQRPKIQDTVTIAQPIFKRKPVDSGETFSAGDRVSHALFGKGEILSVRPMGTDTLYEVIFEKVGTKKLMATYAKLKKED